MGASTEPVAHQRTRVRQPTHPSVNAAHGALARPKSRQRRAPATLMLGFSAALYAVSPVLLQSLGTCGRVRSRLRVLKVKSKSPPLVSPSYATTCNSRAEVESLSRGVGARASAIMWKKHRAEQDDESGSSKRHKQGTSHEAEDVRSSEAVELTRSQCAFRCPPFCTGCPR